KPVSGTLFQDLWNLFKNLFQEPYSGPLESVSKPVSGTLFQDLWNLFKNLFQESYFTGLLESA
ncbi:MAG: hypothetical protein UHO69_08580, partial [Prevotella sp.]|nr:hypothetical protein [Prevotella sp.]